jgi:hypothetical protein
MQPQKLEPLRDLLPRFDGQYVCLCWNCRNYDKDFFTKPCYFRKLFAWKKCKWHEPIARNHFLAYLVLRLLKHGLTLEEAIGFYRRELGSVFEPVKARWQ